MYNKETTEKLAVIAEEKGTYEGIAIYLRISTTKLYAERKNNPDLEKTISEGFEKWHSNNISLKDRVFTKSELEEITIMVRDSNIETASSKFGVSAQVFHNLRKKNSSLNNAIIKGQKERSNNTPLQKAISMFDKLCYQEALDNIHNSTVQGGIKVIEEYYEVSPHILRMCRKELPKLDRAIVEALKKRPMGDGVPGIQEKIAKTRKVNKENGGKRNNKKSGSKRPPKELVDRLAKGVQDDTVSALAKFKQMVQERKLKENRSRLRDGLDDMVGY